MQDRPILADDWQYYEIVADIEEDAKSIVLGLMLFGSGRAWIDDVTLQVVDDSVTSTTANFRARLEAAQGSMPSNASSSFFVPWMILVPIAFLMFVLANSSAHLGWLQRVGVRFSVAYWILYSFPAPLTSIPPLRRLLMSAYSRWNDAAVQWTALNVLGMERSFGPRNGSGDTTADYVKLFLCFALATAITIVWSLMDRRQTDYAWTRDLLRSYVRYVLGFAMLGYGLAKLSLEFNQFPSPDIRRLTQNYGDSSPMGLLWTFMGASRSYTFFAGMGEVIGALLIVWRRTTTLAAIVIFGVMLNVFMMNMCYDVPVKQYSFHLLMMAVFLLLPECGRLAKLFVLNQDTERSDLEPPYVNSTTIWIQRVLKGLLITMGIGVPIFFSLMRESQGSRQAADVPEYFGSYTVDELTIDGNPLPPLATDATRWKYFSIQRLPYSIRGGPGSSDYVLIKMMNDVQVGGEATLSGDFGFSLDVQSPTVPKMFKITPLEDEVISLSGQVEGKPLVARLKRIRKEDFLLVNRGFHWVNETPYNR